MNGLTEMSFPDSKVNGRSGPLRISDFHSSLTLLCSDLLSESRTLDSHRACGSTPFDYSEFLSSNDTSFSVDLVSLGSFTESQTDGQTTGLVSGDFVISLNLVSSDAVPKGQRTVSDRVDASALIPQGRSEIFRSSPNVLSELDFSESEMNGEHRAQPSSSFAISLALGREMGDHQLSCQRRRELLGSIEEEEDSHLELHVSGRNGGQEDGNRDGEHS
jgi:hypothetical protein